MIKWRPRYGTKLTENKFSQHGKLIWQYGDFYSLELRSNAQACSSCFCARSTVTIITTLSRVAFQALLRGAYPPTSLVGIDYFVFLARLTARLLLPKLYLQLWIDYSALVRRGSERLRFFDRGLRCVLRALSLILAAVAVLT